MWKKKKALKKAKKQMLSKVYMWIFIIAAYFTWIIVIWAIAYADLEVCKNGWAEAFEISQWPVWFVLNLHKKDI